MRYCICDSCAKQDKCTEQFMLRHVCNSMQAYIPGSTESGGPGDHPWSYEEWGMHVNVQCDNYKYENQRQLCSCVTKIGPHKFIFDFTHVEENNRQEELDSWMLQYM